jgi:hypothetical protein
MTIRERTQEFWAGERPDVVPYTIYWWEYEASRRMNDPAWHRVFADGLGLTHFMPVATHEARGVCERSDEYEDNGITIRRHTIEALEETRA